MTEVWIDNYGYENCKKLVEESLRKLKTDYIDLVLLHQPFSDYYGAYKALEDLYEEGKIRAISDLNWNDSNSRVVKEHNDVNLRDIKLKNTDVSNKMVEIKKFDKDLSKYNEIIIGSPVWWYSITPVIRTFLHENDLSGKVIKPFVTNAGWLGKTFIEIKKLCPNANVSDGMNIVFESYSDKLITHLEDINNWIDTL